jgi:hypothetical protein
MLVLGAILREPVETTMRFVNWHLAQGVDRLALCFDDPFDPAIDILKSHEKVLTIPCTPAFWIEANVAPDARFTLRQNAAMQYVYDRLPPGWFLNLDADELLYLEGRSLKDEVSAQPAHVKALLIRPAERIQCPEIEGQMHFRTEMPPWCRRAVYGELADAMQKRRGLSGHWIGKSVTLTGLTGHTVRQHFLQTPDNEAVIDVILGREQAAYLLHFIDQGYENWRAKLEWRLSSRGYRGKLRTILQEVLQSDNPEPALRSIYETTFRFDQAEMAKLKRAGACLSLGLGPQDMMAGYFPAEVHETPRYANP